MMRALVTATVPSMIGQFNMNNIKLLQDLGYEVDVACNFNDNSVWSIERIYQFKEALHSMNISIFQIDFERSPKKINNHISSYKQIKQLMNKREYTLIHTHTPISSFITRLAYRDSNIYKTCSMIYTAHGFHFFKGNNPLKNILFRNIEKYGARYTDILITINKEDYEAAKNFKLKENGYVTYVPGVGVDLEKINSITGSKEKLLKELNLQEDSILLLSVGELSERKNHEIVIKSLLYLPNNVHYLICGQGKLDEYLVKMSKNLRIENRFHLLGYRSNIFEIMKSCDVFVFPSLQEGLPVALMEAIACGLPCIASNIRGNNDLLDTEYLFCKDDLNDLCRLEKRVIVDKQTNVNLLKKEVLVYSNTYVNALIKNIYERRK